MNRETKDMIKQAFAIPEPKNRERFLKSLRPRKMSMTDFVLTQIPYIRVVSWAVMFCILGTAILCAARGSGNAGRVIAAMIPFAAATSVVETHRSYACEMMEIEAATRFSLRSILFAKMLIMGIVFLGVFAVVTPIVTATLRTSLISTGANILVPYLITMILCLHVERTKAGRSNMYMSVAVAAGVSVCVLMTGAQAVRFMTNLSEYMMILLASVLCIITVLEWRKTINKVEAFA